MIAIDVETTGVNWHKDRVFGVAMKVKGGYGHELATSKPPCYNNQVKYLEVLTCKRSVMEGKNTWLVQKNTYPQKSD